MNTITELLNLEDSDILIADISIQGTTKTITLETKPTPHYCPICGFKMHSRGVKQRTIKHPVLQDNYELILILKQRRWAALTRNVSMMLANLSNSSISADAQLTQQICLLLWLTGILWKHPLL